MAVEAGFYEQADLWGAENDLDAERTALRAGAMAEMLPECFGGLLDVGTGDGRVLQPLSRLLSCDPVLIGLDRSATALSHLVLPGVQASADALPVADRSVDVVTACEILEHLPGPLYESTISEIARVARRTVLITVPNQERRRRSEVVCDQCGCRYNRRRHLRSFDRGSFEGLLPGFDVVETREFGHHTRIYPRLVRQTLERRGVLGVHDAPECPQCGRSHGRRVTDGRRAEDRRADTGPGSRERRRYVRARSLVPAERRPYWLAVRLDRSEGA